MQEYERESWEKGELVRILGEIKLLDYDMQRGVGHGLVVNAL